MKKAIRYAGLVLGGLVALLLVMLAAARFLITSEQVRSAVLPLAEKALDREISLGDIDIRLFSGIVLHDLTIRDQQGDVPFLQAGRAMLRYRFWPLLRFRVVVDEILLEQPSLRVVRFADGRFNFSDLLDRQKSEGDRKQRSNGSFSLLISKIRLSDGQVQFVDYRPDPDSAFTLNLTDFNLRADGISLTRRFPFEAELALNQARLAMEGEADPSAGRVRARLRMQDLSLPDFEPYYVKQRPGRIKALKIDSDLAVEGTLEQLQSAGRIALKGLHLSASKPEGKDIAGLDISLDYDMRLDRAAAVAELARGDLMLGGLPVTLQGRIEQLGKKPFIRGRVAATRLDLAGLSKKLPAALLGKLPALNPSGIAHLRLQLEGALDKPKALLKSGEIRLEGVSASAGGLRPQLSGLLTLSGDGLQGEKMELQLGGDRALLDLKGENLFGKPIHINSAIRADRLRLDALSGNRSKTAPVTKSAGGTVKKPLGPFNLPVEAVGTLHAVQAQWRGLLIEELIARYRLKDNIFTLEQLAGKTAEGSFSDTARIDLSQPGLAYRTHIKTSAIQADPLLSVLAPRMAGTVFGAMSLDATLQGRGTRLADLKQHLAGQTDLKIVNGKITGAGLVSGLAGFLDLEQLRVLRFSQVAGHLVIKNGRIQVDGDLAGEQARLAPAGSVGMDGSLDVSLPVRLAPELAAHLAGKDKFSRFLTDSRGWGVLPVRLTGTIKAPRFGLDTAALRGSIQQGVREQLQKKLQEKLLPFKDDGTSRQTSEPSAAQDENDASPDGQSGTEEKLLEGVMKGLFGK
ncbi:MULTISPECIES: DUF748 domain-containing protein [Syntrophotalea]|jgi:AsmA protein|uniref:AsmA domain-containing protein n=1 Tax=Syntrophotalea acetylenica TaxID=29542 RepID=A0A1L3GHW1_SYNAC|nr:AsmA family protein [Syntrophotalea acetylenica]APG25536.1 hypothetical protein A7E75_11275 [Syntrophotalea acetylenica]